MGLNAAAGAGALAVIRGFHWFTSTSNPDLWRGLIASFGAIAFFRSSLFIAKIGSSDVPIGTSLMLGALLDACDRAVDRRSAAQISDCIAGDRLDSLDPDRVMTVVPVLSLALMQNFDPGDQAQLGADLSKIREQAELSPEARMRAVLINLAKYLGADLVTKVMAVARPILVPEALPQPVLPPADALLAQTRRQIAESEQAPPQEPGEGGA